MGDLSKSDLTVDPVRDAVEIARFTPQGDPEPGSRGLLVLDWAIGDDGYGRCRNGSTSAPSSTGMVTPSEAGMRRRR